MNKKNLFKKFVPFIMVFAILDSSIDAYDTMIEIGYWKKVSQHIRQGSIQKIEDKKVIEQLIDEANKIYEKSKSFDLTMFFLMENIGKCLSSVQVSLNWDPVKLAVYATPELGRAVLELFEKNYLNYSTDKKSYLYQKILNKQMERGLKLSSDTKNNQSDELNEFKLCEELFEGEEIDLCKEKVSYGYYRYFFPEYCVFVMEFYDYLWYMGWHGPIRSGICLQDYDLAHIALVSPDKFIDDVNRSQLEDIGNANEENIFLAKVPCYISRSRGEKFLLSRVFDAYDYLLELNPQVVEKRKEDIKKGVLKHVIKFIAARDKFYSTYPWRKNKGGYYLLYEFLNADLKYREQLLNLYEKLGTKEDISNLNKLKENFLDLPVWDEQDAYGKSLRNTCIFMQDQFKQKVDQLIEKINATDNTIQR